MTQVWNFTRDMRHGAGVRGARRAELVGRLNLVGLLRMSTFIISPFACTHEDLPEMVDWEVIAGMQGDSDDTHGTLSHVLRRRKGGMASGWDRGAFREYDCILLNLFDRGVGVESLLREKGLGEPQTRGAFLDPVRMTSEDLVRMLETLAVRREDLTFLKEVVDKPAETMVVLCSGWDRFNVGNLDPLGQVWAGWHPALLHPYLDLDAVEFLIDELGIAGIGTDCVSVEFPLALTGPDVFGYVSQVIRQIALSGSLGKSRVSTLPAIHLHFLAYGATVVEQLQVDQAVFVDPAVRESAAKAGVRPEQMLGYAWHGMRKWCRGTFGMCPIPFGSRGEGDSQLIAAVFRERGL